MNQDVALHDVLDIAAFLPGYQDGEGQGLDILLRKGGNVWRKQGLRPFIKTISKVFAVDQVALRHSFGPMLGQINLVPLAFSPSLIFLPLKFQKPRVAGDPAYGYFRLRSVIKVEPVPAPCTIYIEGGHRVTVLQSLATTRKRLRKSREMENIILERYLLAMENKGCFFCPKILRASIKS